MGYLRPKLNVICRTAEEEQIYREVATKEGFYWHGGKSLLQTRHGSAPCSFQIDYFHDKHVTYSNDANYQMPQNFTTIEASVLFRNELISRRVKNGRT